MFWAVGQNLSYRADIVSLFFLPLLWTRLISKYVQTKIETTSPRISGQLCCTVLPISHSFFICHFSVVFSFFHFFFQIFHASLFEIMKIFAPMICQAHISHH